jgi:DNA-directed RNA polymerase specialized sigma24 family protein
MKSLPIIDEKELLLRLRDGDYTAFEKLPEQRKKVFLLCKLEKKSYAEVSRLLQISEAAVNDHITKANRFLRDNYDKAIPFAVVVFCNHLIR